MNEVLIKFESEDKTLSLYIEDNRSSAWAYLKECVDGVILKDAFIYSPIEPSVELNKEEISQGMPPALISKYASDEAVLKNAQESAFDVEWSSEGDSVAILYNGNPLAAIYSSEERGYSKALGSESGFGNPWSEEMFNEHFATNC
jgi:hypothetical protein